MYDHDMLTKRELLTKRRSGESLDVYSSGHRSTRMYTWHRRMGYVHHR